jgi:hypothetical protein
MIPKLALASVIAVAASAFVACLDVTPTPPTAAFEATLAAQNNAEDSGAEEGGVDAGSGDATSE